MNGFAWGLDGWFYGEDDLEVLSGLGDGEEVVLPPASDSNRETSDG